MLNAHALELGVNIGLDPDNAAQDCADAATLGFSWVRTSQEMQWGGGTTGQYALDALQTYADACNDNGLHLIQCAQGMPAPMARGGVEGHYGPKNDTCAAQWGEWFAACAAIVATTGGVTSCLNEANGFGWDTTPSSSDVAVLHAAALEARDRDAPGTTFATSELCPGSGANEPLAFLQRVAAAVPALLTARHVWLGWHPYTDPRYPADYDAIWNTCHRMRDLAGWSGKPRRKVLAGEWAIANGPTGNVRALSPQGVADYVRDQYLPTFRTQKRQGVPLGPACWYTLRDADSPSSWADYCGVLDHNGDAKPVAEILYAENVAFKLAAA